jgi:2-keto-4-pentenoate hydratase
MSLEAGARRIAAARLAGDRLENLPEAERPKDLDDAYRLQRHLATLWDDRRIGWKVGATSDEVQRLFRISHPLYGPCFARNLFHSPARLRSADFQHRILESEFAFRFARDLAPRPERYQRDEILEAVDAMIPALEIVSPRFNRLPIDDIPLLVADFCANGGIVLGTPCEDWRKRDLRSHPVSLSIDGALRQAGTGAEVLGDPLNVLDWTVNALSEAGLGIAQGHLVLTGSMTGVHAPAPGQRAVADFGNLGTVEVVFD